MAAVPPGTRPRAELIEALVTLAGFLPCIPSFDSRRPMFYRQNRDSCGANYPNVAIDAASCTKCIQL
ncbi:hypothetical protein JOF47_003998 [Paeniglutamicibacter kerguelensis]|uniref:Uncharacterized protein n=1 Tax=Paeniglutamicibacter kerguelensis TaxID=254788 RepID=A0ABS4XIX8_9MICC|nr:hypothetical protein [Paeniglutamicibacter kerguelensis]